MSRKMTTEAVLMYTVLVTAVLQHAHLSVIVSSLVVVAVSGSVLIIRTLNIAEDNPKQQRSIWEDVTRAAPCDWVCNCVYSLLVPVAIVLSTITRTQYEGQSDYGKFLQSMAVTEALTAAVLVWSQVTSGGSCKKLSERRIQQQRAAWSVFLCTLAIALAFSALNSYIFEINLMSTVIQSIAVLVQCFVQAFLPLWCPKSFTFGEVAILAEAVAQYVGCTMSSVMQKYEMIFTDSTMPAFVCDTNYYMEIAILCCALVVTSAFIIPWCRTVLGFYITFASVIGFVAIPVLRLLLGQNFIQWTVTYITENTWKRKLFIYWMECCGIGILIVLIGSGTMADLLQASFAMIRSRLQSHSTPDHISLKSVSHTKRTASQVSTRMRKLFHLLAVAIFVPGAMQEPTMTCVAGTCCLVVFIMMELMRLTQIPPLFQPLQQTFILFLDEKDQGPVILTHIYLLVGCVLPMWLYPIHAAPKSIALYAGVISVGVGDTFAAVIGSMIGRHHWQGSRKTKEGTLAAIIGQLLFIFLLFTWGAFVTPTSWLKVIVAVILTSLVEAHTLHVDNLVLPLTMYSLLL